jgi:hypothetical protein
LSLQTQPYQTQPYQTQFSQTQARTRSADFSGASYVNDSSNNAWHNYALTEVSLALINALSQIQQQQVQQIPSLGTVQLSEAQPTLLSTSHIKTAIQSTGGELLVDERAQDEMKLIDMLLSFILEDKNLPDPIKLLLARLQNSFIKVTLADEDFLKKKVILLGVYSMKWLWPLLAGPVMLALKNAIRY